MCVCVCVCVCVCGLKTLFENRLRGTPIFKLFHHIYIYIYIYKHFIIESLIYLSYSFPCGTV